MYELVYQSVSVANMTAGELTRMVTAARKFNETQNISGVLIFDGEKFLQILEGEKSCIEEVYGKIKNDKRHKNVNTMWRGKISTRTFGCWSLALLHADDKPLIDKIGNLSFSKVDRSTNTTYGCRVLYLLSQTLDQENFSIRTSQKKTASGVIL